VGIDDGAALGGLVGIDGALVGAFVGVSVMHAQ
jgi:hypothetical protein